MDFANPEATAKAGIEALRSFLTALGMPRTIGELGGSEEDIPTLVNVLCRGDGRNGTIGGFLTLDEEQCAEIYRAML
jgi:hypothetical protein